MEMLTKHDQPLWLLDTLDIRLRIPQRLPFHAFRVLDLLACAVADEDGFAAPFDNDIFALGDGGEVDLDFSLCEHVRRGGHVDQEIYLPD